MAGPGEVRVSLVWSEGVDLDLYVTDPSLETVYFANSAAQSGGRLARDVSCDALFGRKEGDPEIEAVVWENPPPGRYRVGVDFIDACAGPSEDADFRVVAEVFGKREERAGRVSRAIFQPVVLEFDVPPR